MTDQHWCDNQHHTHGARAEEYAVHVVGPQPIHPHVHCKGNTAPVTVNTTHLCTWWWNSQVLSADGQVVIVRVLSGNCESLQTPSWHSAFNNNWLAGTAAG